MTENINDVFNKEVNSGGVGRYPCMGGGAGGTSTPVIRP